MSKLAEEELRRYWLDFAARYCNRNWDNDAVPYVIRLFIDQKVNAYRQNPNVKTESLADMSKTYMDSQISQEERELLNTARRLRVPK